MGVERQFWQDKRVLVTGHTGFKGSWLSLWLQRLGAKILGYSLPPPTSPNLFDLADVGREMESVIADVRDHAKVRSVLESFKPEVVFHLAAQSLVHESYRDPFSTYSHNLMATVSLLEAVRMVPTVHSMVVVTSDKCYRSRNDRRNFVESDPLGGADPYSSSKACVELITAAYRDSFFESAAPNRVQTWLASARAGNVIGGGDWAADRLLPDIVRAVTLNTVLKVRCPEATRPWQHVLDVIRGYLMLAERLYNDGSSFAEAWNFGPAECEAQTVIRVIEKAASIWPAIRWEKDDKLWSHESRLLQLDPSKARNNLGWNTKLNFDASLEQCINWYKEWHAGANARDLTFKQIDVYEKL